MSDPQFTAMMVFAASALAAIPGIIAAIGAIGARRSADQALSQSEANGREQASNTVITREAAATATRTADKTDDLIKKTEEIHVLTNSNLTQVKAELTIAVAAARDAQVQIKSMQRVIAALVDAQTRAAGGIAPMIPPEDAAIVLGGAVVDADEKTIGVIADPRVIPADS